VFEADMNDHQAVSAAASQRITGCRSYRDATQQQQPVASCYCYAAIHCMNIASVSLVIVMIIIYSFHNNVQQFEN